MKGVSPLIASLCMALAWTSTATAQEDLAAGVVNVQIALEAPAECPDQESVRSEVAQLLRGSTETIAEARLQVTRDASTWNLTLETGGGTRVLTSISCEDLLHAASLVIAMAIDPDAVARASQVPAPEPEPAPMESGELLSIPSAGPAPVLPRDRATSTPVTIPHPIDIIAGAHFALLAGALPDATLGANARIGIAWRRLEIGASTRWAGSSEQRLASFPNAGGSFSLLAARIDAALEFDAKIIKVLPRIFVEVGAVSWQSFGVTHPTEGSSFWLAAGTGIEARLPLLDWLSVSTFVDLIFPLRQLEFVLDDLPGREIVHEPSAMGACFGLGVVLQ